MRHEPRDDSRGILDPGLLLRRVRFRRRLPDPALRPWVEHYWLIDWDLTEPFEQRVVPHPSVNVVFQAQDDTAEHGLVAGVDTGLFAVTLHGAGRVTGVQFRPGGFRPFWDRPVAELTGRRVALPAGGGPICPGSDDERCRRLDDLLAGWGPAPDPAGTEAVALVEEIRTDRSVLRVADLACRHGVSTRRLQRLFLDHVGVGPKWVIRRYRLQEAIERAAAGPLDWSRVAADLGYADQAHLVREFTAVTGVPPAAYARSVAGSRGA
ncbi:DUF6597 domain-containing transcriptional factor [Micromonospora sp. NPDC051300]|uniref:DUF6597 domain-containing transcriptional factor n=1 Tax=Micromonospora sp. NPDC051300 TaxID=3364286 RepID=UPI0037A4A0B0